MALAVKVGAVAIPLESVGTETVERPPVNVPLALLLRAEKVTLVPLTGLPPESFTVASNAVENAVFMLALWPEPAVAVILVGEAVTVLMASSAELLDKLPPM
jgi:hypothetical protein